jgi:drug/metabolite transporter (DMT)-like permease
MKLLHLSLIILSVISVAIADVFLKRAALNDTFFKALKSPWMVGAILLYLFQIFFFTYVFVSGWKLSLIGSLQTVLYAVIVLGASIVVFRERLTTLQTIGLLLAAGGVILINLE